MKYKSLEDEIDDIHSRKPEDPGSFEWLCKELDRDDSSVRAAAVHVLVHQFDRPELTETWWHLLETERDQDVVIPAIGALARRYRSTKDVEVIRRLHRALSSHQEVLDGTQEAVDDAILTVFTGLSGADLLRMDRNAREQQLAQVRDLL